MPIDHGKEHNADASAVRCSSWATVSRSFVGRAASKTDTRYARAQADQPCL